MRFSGASKFLLPAAVFLLFAVLLPRSGSCATFWNWGRTYGGPWMDLGAGVQPTPDGGALVVGETFSFKETGYQDAWVLKLRAGGGVEWEKALGGELWDSLFAVRGTRDGGYIAVGDRVPPEGGQDAWVVKLTADGQIAWEKLYGREGYFDHALAVEPTADGGFIVAGWTQSEQFDAQPDGWVFKLTSEGEVEWQRLLGGPGLDTLFSVQQTSDGGYVVAGGAFSFGEDLSASDAWLVKLRPNGEIAWQKTYGGDGDEAAYSVRQSADGRYFLLAWTTSFGLGGGDIWVLRLDRDGQILWQKSYGGQGFDIGYALQTTFDGGAVVAGSTASFGAGQDDGWILKLSSTGQIHWQRTYGGGHPDLFRDLRTTPHGYIATGSSRSFGAGNENVWVLNVPLSGNLSWSPIDRPSFASARQTVSAPRPVVPFAQETFVQPVPSRVEVSSTNSVHTSLARPPWRRTSLSSVPQGGAACLPWPVFAGAMGFGSCISR